MTAHAKTPLEHVNDTLAQVVPVASMGAEPKAL